MSIKCTYGDLGRLRSLPGNSGPLAKIMDFHPSVSVIDRWKVVKLVKAVGAKIDEYEQALGEVAKKYGTSKNLANGAVTYEIPAEKLAEFKTEEKKLNDTECDEILLSPLPVSAYEHADLKASDLMLLEKFLVMPEET